MVTCPTRSKTVLRAGTILAIGQHPSSSFLKAHTLIPRLLRGQGFCRTGEDVAGYTLRFYSSEATNPNDRLDLEVVWSQTPRTVYFLKDHLGSIRAAVYDSANAVKEKWNNQPGLNLACRNPAANSPAKKLDSEPNIRIL